MRHARAQPGCSEAAAGPKMTIPTTGYPPVASEPHFVSVSKIRVLAVAPAVPNGRPWSAGASFSSVLTMTQEVQAHGSAWLSKKHHPPVQYSVSFGSVGSTLCLEGAFPLANAGHATYHPLSQV